MAKKRKSTGRTRKPADEVKPMEKTAAWRLPTPLLAKLKAFSAVTGRDQRDLVTEALGLWLDAQIAKSKDKATVLLLAKRMAARSTSTEP